MILRPEINEFGDSYRKTVLFLIFLFFSFFPETFVRWPKPKPAKAGRRVAEQLVLISRLASGPAAGPTASRQATMSSISVQAAAGRAGPQDLRRKGCVYMMYIREFFTNSSSSTKRAKVINVALARGSGRHARHA